MIGFLLINVIVGIFLIVECRCYEPLFEKHPNVDRVWSAACLIVLVFAGPTIVVSTYAVRGVRRLLG